MQGGSISRQSHVSHTPSPKPDREQMHTPVIGPHAPSMRSGERSHPHSERRSALERLAGSNERIPLLLDGEANADSGRLQRSNAHVVDDLRHRRSSGGSSKPPSPRTAGKTLEDKSPIRTLSEDRRHVFLRLGPMVDSEETIIEDIPLPRKSIAANQATLRAQGKKKAASPTASRKRVVRSPLQEVSVKRRRTTKSQPSSKRRLVPASGAALDHEAGTSRAARPLANMIPATTRKGTDFQTAPKPLP